MKNFRLNHNELLQSLGLPTSSTEDLFETKPKNFNVTKRDNINRELILCMTIDLGDGKNDVLNIYSNDDPKDLARHFCIKNHLNMEAVEILTENIMHNLNNNMENHENNENLGDEDDYRNDEADNKKNLYEPHKFYKKTRKFDEISENVDKNIEEIEYLKQSKKDHSNVYDRLYQTGLAKQENENVKKEHKKAVSSIPNEKKNEDPSKKLIFQNEQNYGVKLYLKGIKQKEEQQSLAQNIKKEKYEQEEKEMTFKPKLKKTKLSQFKNNREIKSIGDHLILMGKKNKETKEKLLAEKQKEETNGCSFKPQIDQISQKIMIEKSKISSENPEAKQKVYERLYNQTKEKETNEKKKAEESENSNYSFKPHLISDPMVSNDLPFLERMAKMQKAREEKLKEMRKNEKSNEKEEFHPKIGRAPKIERNTHNLPIGDYLHLSKLEKEEKKKEILSKETRDFDKLKAKSNEKSNAIFENIKTKKIEEYFILMDSDNDGEISAHKIEIAKLPILVLEKIAPLLCEMEQMNLTLDFFNFQLAFNKLANNFTIDEKNRLFFDTKEKWNEKKKKLENYSFKPEINKKSKKISEEKKGYKNMRIFYENNKEISNHVSSYSDNKENDEKDIRTTSIQNIK